MLLPLLAGLAGSCEKTPEPGAIDIRFQFDSYDIDLNIADNPYITCVINSEQELSSVSMYILYEDGTQESYKEPLTSFFNTRLCSIHERPVYTETMSGFRVVAEDRGGAVVSKEASFVITPAISAPEIALKQESLYFAEGDPVPPFSFEVTAQTALQSIGIELIESGDAVPFLDPNPYSDFSGETSYLFESENFTFVDYDLTKIPSALRITVTDSYGKTAIAVLPIDYKALPAPTLTVDPMAVPVDEYAACSVTGRVTSNTGVEEITCYALGENYECEVGSQHFDAALETDFRIEIDGNEMRDYVTAFRVVAKDARNKTTTEEIPVTVNPRYTEVAAGTDLKALLAEQQADDKYRSIKLRLAAGTYEMGSDAVTINKRLLLTGDAEGDEMPELLFSGSNTFLTDHAAVSEIAFENIRFRSTSTGSHFMANSANNGCAIGSILLRGCRFEGFVNTLYRTQAGGTEIGSIEIDNCILEWANTGNTYALFHISQNGDRIGRIRITNSTFSGAYYLHYNNMTNTTLDFEVSNCTFVNTRSKSGGYFVSFQNGSLKGTVKLHKLLFGGSNNVSGGYRMLRANTGMSPDLEDNYCTPDWKTFTDDSTNGSVNFLTTLDSAENNDALFRDVENLDLTITPGTTIYVKGVGDPRWIK